MYFSFPFFIIYSLCTITFLLLHLNATNIFIILYFSCFFTTNDLDMHESIYIVLKCILKLFREKSLCGKILDDIYDHTFGAFLSPSSIPPEIILVYPQYKNEFKLISFCCRHFIWEEEKEETRKV